MSRLITSDMLAAMQASSNKRHTPTKAVVPIRKLKPVKRFISAPKPKIVLSSPQKLKPKDVPKKRHIYNIPDLDDVPKPAFIRPKAEYSNRSPYGIAAELLMQQNTKTD